MLLHLQIGNEEYKTKVYKSAGRNFDGFDDVFEVFAHSAVGLRGGGRSSV